MNLQLSDERVRATCRELIKKQGTVSGRGLREELRRRFGAVGKTTRVFRIWREECGVASAVASAPVSLGASVAKRAGASVAVSGEVLLLQKRLQAAEAKAGEYLQRAELAEFRERAHQDHWALEIDRLRQEVAALSAKAKPFPV